MYEKHRIGAEGEDVAMDYLREQGYTIVERNWRRGSHMELDIVAEQGGTLHFIEVKTRSSESWQSPEAAITPQKVRALVRAVNNYVTHNNVECEVTLDLVAIENNPDGSHTVRFIPDIANLSW